MNRYIKWRTLLGASAALALLAPGASAHAETITIVATSDAVPRFELAAKVFKERTGHDIEITSTGYDQSHAMIVTSQEARSSAFDIAKVDTIWVAGFARSGYCVPLDDLIDPAEWEDTVEASRKAMTYDGKIWAKGGGNASVNFYYNERLLKEAGFDHPPATLEEMIAQATEIQRKGLTPYGTAWGWSQGEGVVIDYTWLVQAFGGRMQDDDGAFIFNNEAGVAALKFMVDQLKGGLADPASLQFDNRAVVQLFIKGDVPFMFNWPFTWTWGKDPTRSQIVDDIRVTIIPPYSGNSPVKSATVVGNSGHCVLASSNRKELAWEFLKLASSAEMERRYVTELNDFTTVTHHSVFNDPALQDLAPQFAIYAKQLEYASNRPELAWYAQFSSILASSLHRALTGGGEPQAVLDEVVGRLNDLRNIYAGNRQ
jgi:multiple sugar transport system substrate-binding protein